MDVNSLTSFSLHNSFALSLCSLTIQDILKKAIESNMKARVDWEKRPLKERCDIFLRAADMIAKERRMNLIASTMLGQVRAAVGLKAYLFVILPFKLSDSLSFFFFLNKFHLAILCSLYRGQSRILVEMRLQNAALQSIIEFLPLLYFVAMHTLHI